MVALKVTDKTITYRSSGIEGLDRNCVGPEVHNFAKTKAMRRIWRPNEPSNVHSLLVKIWTKSWEFFNSKDALFTKASCQLNRIWISNNTEIRIRRMWSSSASNTPETKTSVVKVAPLPLSIQSIYEISFSLVPRLFESRRRRVNSARDNTRGKTWNSLGSRGHADAPK